MITAQKARSIQILQIGRLKFIEELVLRASMDGKDNVSVTDENVGVSDLNMLRENGFNVNWNESLKEWRISWSK